MVTSTIMARIQGQIISPISSSVASMTSHKVTEKLVEFGKEAAKTTRELLGSKERHIELDSYERIGVASGDEPKDGLIDRLFKKAKKNNDISASEKPEIEEKRWALAETELLLKGIDPTIEFDPETAKVQIEYVGQFINGIKHEYAAEMVRQYKEMAVRSQKPPDFKEAFVSVMERHFQGQTPGLRLNIDALGESLGYASGKFERLMDLHLPTLKANIGTVTSMVGTRVATGLDFIGATPYLQQANNLVQLHLAPRERTLLGLELGIGTSIGASKLVGAMKSKYGAAKLTSKVPVENVVISPKSSAMTIIRDNKTGKIQGVTDTQKHHIIHESLQKHPIWNKAGINVNDRGNIMLLPTKEGAKTSTTTRSIHEGRHLQGIKKILEQQMDRALAVGQQKGYSMQQYRQELQTIISKERGLLKSGERALNKNARPWAKK